MNFVMILRGVNYMSMFDTTDKITEAMLAGLKDAIKADIKTYLAKEVDNMLEEIAINLTKKCYVNMVEQADILNMNKNLNIQMLFCDTKGKEKKFKAVSEIKVNEVFE
jgi:ribosomal protein S8